MCEVCGNKIVCIVGNPKELNLVNCPWCNRLVPPIEIREG